MLSVRNLSLAVLALALAVSFSATRVSAEEQGKGTVSGKVTKADGSAAANAKVQLMHGGKPGKKGAPAAAEDKPAPGDKPKPVAETTADADGKYTLADVPAGKYVIRAGIKGEGMGHQDIEVKAGETTTADIQMKAPKAK
jgi:protocatechuate 3,4-dioxygenase beta subunit